MFTIKRGVASLAVAGGAAAMLFGGTAVSTAFTSSSAQAPVATGASVGVHVSGGSFTASGLVPGAAATTETVTVYNTGNTSANASIQFGNAVVKHYGNNNGTNETPNNNDLEVSVAGISHTMAYWLQHPLLGSYPVAANSSVQIPVTVGLVSGAGNSWNGGSVEYPYTVTLTAGS